MVLIDAFFPLCFHVFFNESESLEERGTKKSSARKNSRRPDRSRGMNHHRLRTSAAFEMTGNCEQV